MKFLKRAVVIMGLFFLPLAVSAQEKPSGQEQQPSVGAKEPGTEAQKQPQMEKSARAKNGATVFASSVDNSKVVDQQGNEIGSVKALRIDPNEGRITSVDIAMSGRRGGIIGAGEQTISVSWESVELMRDQDKLVLVVKEQVVPQAPKQKAAQKQQDQQKQAK